MIPASIQRSTTVTLTGGEVKVHGLTMGQVHLVKSKGEGPDSDMLAVVLACDLDHAEVAEWYKTAAAGDVEAIITAAFALSRVDGAARFPDTTSHDAGAVGSGS